LPGRAAGGLVESTMSATGLAVAPRGCAGRPACGTSFVVATSRSHVGGDRPRARRSVLP
jgi:hypothetical protein